MLTTIIPQMCFLLRMDLDLLCCNLEDKWEQSTHTHTPSVVCEQHRFCSRLAGSTYETTTWQSRGSIHPNSRTLEKAWVPLIYFGVLSQEKQVGDKRKKYRRGKCQHKDASLSWPPLYETGCWIPWDHIGYPCCPPRKKRENIAPAAPVAHRLRIDPWGTTSCTVFDFMCMRAKHFLKEPHTAAMGKTHNEGHSTGLRVTPWNWWKSLLNWPAQQWLE